MKKKVILMKTFVAILSISSLVSCQKEEINVSHNQDKATSLEKPDKSNDMNSLYQMAGIESSRAAYGGKVVPGRWDRNMDSPSINCKNDPNKVCYIEISPNRIGYQVIGDANPLPDDNLYLLNGEDKVGVKYGVITQEIEVDNGVMYLLR